MWSGPEWGGDLSLKPVFLGPLQPFTGLFWKEFEEDSKATVKDVLCSGTTVLMQGWRRGRGKNFG